MKTRTYIIIGLLLPVCCVPARAQFYLDGVNNNNNGGIVSYYENTGIINSSGTYSAINNALTVHGGSSLAVNGPYNTTGSSIDSFAGNGTAVWPPVAAPKNISGSVAPTFAIAKFMNGTGQAFNITNTAGINVGQRIDFANGITTTVRNNTQAGAVRLLDNATYTNTSLGDVQHVNGYVSKTGNDAFTYPVGSGSDLRTLAISAPATATDAISVAYWSGDVGTAIDPTGGAHSRSALDPSGIAGSTKIRSISAVGFWDWIPVSGSSPVSTVTLSIPDVSTLPGFTTASALRLVGWNTATGQWENLGGTTGASGTTEGSTLTGTVANMANYSAITVGSILRDNPPDLTPTFQFRRTTLNLGQSTNAIVTITNMGSGPAIPEDGLIRVRIAKPDPGLGYTITSDGIMNSITIFSATAVDNSIWSFSEDALNLTFVLLSPQQIATGASMKLGFTVTRQATGPTADVVSVTATIRSGSGGETVINNNQVNNNISGN